MKWKGKKTKVKQQKKAKENEPSQVHQYELDMYIRATSDCTPFLLLEELLKDVCEFSYKLDVTAKQLDDIEILPDDEVWMEIAVTPESLLAKLWQLQRNSMLLQRVPKVAIVCLNGEPEKMDMAVEAITKVRDNDPKKVVKLWPLLADTPVFVIWTPYRNVYGTEGYAQELSKGLQELKGNVDSILKILKGQFGG